MGQHDVAELIHAVFHAEVVEVEVGNAFEEGCDFVHEIKVEADFFEYVGVLDFDGDGGSGGVETVGGSEAGFVDCVVGGREYI